MSDKEKTTKPTSPRDRSLRFLFLSLVMFSGVFSGMVIGAMVMTQLDPRNVHPPETPELAQLKALLEKDPENQQLRELFRSLDQDNLQYHQTRRKRMTTGAVLLVVGLVVLVVSARCYAGLDKRVPVMKPRDDGITEEVWLTPRRRNVLAVTAVAVVLALVTVITIRIGGIRLSEEGDGQSAFKENWPGFRGPDGIGIAPEGDWPTTWDAKSGKNILWKSEVPLPGRSSPVVWADRIFLTGASPELQELFCYDRASGRLLWRSPVHSAESLHWQDGDEDEQVFISEFTGSAAQTPVTDGKLVYVCFNSNDVGAVDFSGKVKWVSNLGKPESVYGLASSLLLHKDTLIYQCDQGSSADEELSAIYGLDTKTGNVIWRTDRPVPNSWSTPILARTKDRVEVITTADPWVIAYEPEYGEELWRANVMGGGEIGSSAAYADSVVFVTDDEVELVAIRTGGKGDVTKTHVLWRPDVGLRVPSVT